MFSKGKLGAGACALSMMATLLGAGAATAAPENNEVDTVAPAHTVIITSGKHIWGEGLDVEVTASAPMNMGLHAGLMSPLAQPISALMFGMAARIGIDDHEALLASSVDANGELANQISSLPQFSDVDWNQEKGQLVVDIAKRYVGLPYVWGATGPYAYDCSGLTKTVYAQIGIELPRTSWAQPYSGTRVSAADARPGDLLWWPGHVAIYIGNGRMIGAQNPSVGIVEKAVYGNPMYIRLNGMGSPGSPVVLPENVASVVEAPVEEVVQVDAEPTEEPTTEPSTEPSAEPTKEPKPTKPADPKPSEPAKPADPKPAEPTPTPTPTEPVTEPTEEPTEPVTEEPSEEPSEEPTETASPDPTDDPSEDPDEEDEEDEK